MPLGAIVRERYMFLGLRGIQILRVTYKSYLGKLFVSLTNKIQSFQRFKNFRHFRVIEPIRKDGNDGKLPI